GGSMRRSLLSAFVVSCFLSALLLAQGGFGRIHGTVTDTTGAPLPGVQVTLAGSNSFQRSTLTSEKGEFWFRDIGPGRYEVTASLSGFQSRQTTTFVSADFTRELTLMLTVGSLAETVTVTGASPRVQSRALAAVGVGTYRQPFN